jgi:hypothetical protein
MRLAPDPANLPSRRGRRILIALLILLLVLLPLYLWPLRGGMSGFPGASALSGPPRDPRNPAALAGIPSDVWDALMERTGSPLPGVPKPIRNLTMIAEHHGGDGPGTLDVGTDGSSLFAPGGSHLATLFGEGASGAAGSTPGPVHFSTASSNDDQGTGNGSPGFGPGGYPGLPNLGPWSGGGPGGGGGGGPRLVSLGPTSDPGDPGVAAPTPEPATIVLVGSNVALIGAMVLKHRHRRRETDLSG